MYVMYVCNVCNVNDNVNVNVNVMYCNVCMYMHTYLGLYKDVKQNVIIRWKWGIKPTMILGYKGDKIGYNVVLEI